MSYSESACPTPRRVRMRSLRVAGLLVVIAASVTALGDQLTGASSSTTSESPPRNETPAPPLARHPGHSAALGEADGAVPDRTTVFDGGIPAVAKLDPALLGALRRAATDAAGDGVTFYVDSGWRSARYQQHLRDDAVAKYGSEQAAARWVDMPGASAHVTGHAVDIGPPPAAAWLSVHGARYGLCQIYGNEPWHYELRPAAATHGCPPMYADPTHDPRTKQ